MTKAPAPAFEIVLSEEQLEDLGRFTAIFSQIDFMMFQVIAHAARLQAKDLMALIEGTTTGQRLAMLRRLAKHMPDPDLRKKAEDVCSGLAGLNDHRNHILHGVWGLEWDTERDVLRPACAYERNRDNNILATKLPELCDRAATLSRKVGELLGIFNSVLFHNPQQGPRRL